RPFVVWWCIVRSRRSSRRTVAATGPGACKALSRRARSDAPSAPAGPASPPSSATAYTPILMDRSPTGRYSTAGMGGFGGRRAWDRALAAGLALFLPAMLAAEEPPIQVNPNRPTFATPALTTQAGVAELDIGVTRSPAPDPEARRSTPLLLHH